jgi:flagellar biosynthetic protein FliQ
MTSATAMDMVREAILLLLVISLPALGAALVVGLVVSILQAVTQVSDPTLSFVPKILAVLAALAIAGSWMMTLLVEFARTMVAELD